MEKLNLHPATCTQCCKRIVTGSSRERMRDLLADIVYTIREVSWLIGKSSLMVFGALFIFIPAMINGQQRKLSWREWESVKEIVGKQKDITRDIDDLHLVRNAVRDEIDPLRPTEAEHMELLRNNQDITRLESNWRQLHRARADIVHRR